MYGRIITGVAGLLTTAGVAIGGGLAHSGGLNDVAAQLRPDNAALAAPGAAVPAGAARGASTRATTAPAASSPTGDCHDGSWSTADGVSVQGRPEGLDRGDQGAVSLWHDADGWHIRATDVRNVDHRYTGTIRLSTDGRFIDVNTVRLEADDHIWVDGANLLHYSFNTYHGIDGVNVRVASSCGSNDGRTRMTFALDYDGREHDASRIVIGAEGRHPTSGTFDVVRTA